MAEDVGRVIDGLIELNKAMNKNQCYACAYEFVVAASKFGTEILVDAIEKLKEMQKENDELKAGRTEIVRCKDCEYHGGKDYHCPCNSTGDPFLDWVPDEDWFCADGKRKEGGGT